MTKSIDKKYIFDIVIRWWFLITHTMLCILEFYSAIENKISLRSENTGNFNVFMIYYFRWKICPNQWKCLFSDWMFIPPFCSPNNTIQRKPILILSQALKHRNTSSSLSLETFIIDVRINKWLCFFTPNNYIKSNNKKVSDCEFQSSFDGLGAQKSKSNWNNSISGDGRRVSGNVKLFCKILIMKSKMEQLH